MCTLVCSESNRAGYFTDDIISRYEDDVIIGGSGYRLRNVLRSPGITLAELDKLIDIVPDVPPKQKSHYSISNITVAERVQLSSAINTEKKRILGKIRFKNDNE